VEERTNSAKQYIMADSIIILANGEFPVEEIPLGYLEKADKVVCCDGAAVKLIEYGKEPWAIIGDLDSLPESVKEKYSDRLFLDDDQETNDLTKAVLFCLMKGIKEIIILGATGIREDHTLANISLLLEYADFINVKLITNNGIFIPLLTSSRVSSWAGQRISIFSPDTRLEITSSGLKYPLDRLMLGNWWRGSLNESLSDHFTLNFNDGRVLVYLDMINM